MKNWILHIIFYLFSTSFCLEYLSGIGFLNASAISVNDNSEEQPEKETKEKSGIAKETTSFYSHNFDIWFSNKQSYSTLTHPSFSKPYLSLHLRPPQLF